MLRTASIYGRQAAKRGALVLVTRYWPRGFVRGAFHAWARDLAPSAGLLTRYRAGTVPWPEFERLYRIEMCSGESKAALEDVRWLAREGDVTLLCYEPDGKNCHRNILLDILNCRMGADSGA